NVSLWWTFGGGSKLIVNTGLKAPSVSLLPPSPLQLSEKSFLLLCLLSDYSPQGALVSWIVDGSEVKDGVLTSAEEEKNGRYSRSSTLTLSKDLWEKGEEFICMVSHSNVVHPVMFRKKAPTVSLLFQSPLQSCEDSLLCLLSDYSPQGALVSWIVDGSEVKDGVLTSAEEEKNGCYSRSSILTLSKDLWEKGEEFICKVSHSNFIHPVTFRKSQC
ncbi:immunoglobulin lambda-1 light chain-like isoform X2, partial [Silurus meridionalis]